MFCAYGDDSQYENVLVYAFAIIHRKNLEEFNKAINGIRAEYKFPETEPIHCRILFSGDQRKKRNLDHIDFRSLISRLIEEANKVPILCRYCHTNLPKNKIMHEKYEDFPQITNDTKGILSILLQGCFAVAANGTEGPTSKDTQIFVSGDKTVIKFIGDTRKQAELHYSAYSEIGASEGEEFFINPHIIQNADWKNYPLLQLADIYSYICSHALNTKDETNYFLKEFKKIKHYSGSFMSSDLSQIPTINNNVS